VSRLPLIAGVILGISVFLAAPFVTLHALATHRSTTSHEGGMAWLRDPGLGVVGALTLAAALPLLGLSLALVERHRASRRLRRVEAAATRRTARGIEYWRFPSDSVTVFVAGAVRPRVYVSSGAEATLSQDGLHAALLHERAHCERGDVLHRQFLHGVDRAFGRLPGVRAAVDAHLFRSECRADEAALAAGADRRALFDAIVAAASPSPAGAASLSSGVVVPRLEALAGVREPVTAIGWRAPVAIASWLAFPPLAAHLVVQACARWVANL
jgi:Zn-dependent protease with chaperone function